jgi:hypothetical protein
MASGDTLLIFTPLHNSPPASNLATWNVRNGTAVLEFDTATQESAIFCGVMPRNYSGAGITVSVHWAAATATAGTIGWDVAFERIGDGQQDLDADDFATAQTITATTVPATSGLVDITSVAITNGDDTANIAVGETFRLRVRRDVSNDNAAGDAQLLAVHLRES